MPKCVTTKYFQFYNEMIWNLNDTTGIVKIYVMDEL